MRLPLWAAFVPLVLGGAFWAVVWRGHAANLENELRALLPPGTAIETGGFPYRLEARIPGLAVGRRHGGLQGALQSRELLLNRVPWQRDRQVLVAFGPEARLAVPALPGVNLAVKGPAAQASLHMEQGRIARLSIVWPSSAVATGGLLPAAVRAGHLEMHFRDMAADAAPTRAQIVVSGEELRFGGGAPLQLALAADIAAPARLRSLAAFLAGGVVTIGSATLADAGGEVARFHGTIRPGEGGLRLDGEIATFCPATVRAAVAGTVAMPEKRARKAETLKISGRFPGGLAIPPRDEARPLPPVRGQEAPCPLLR